MNNPGRQALLGLVAGAVALVVLTAILTAAVSSSSADGRLGDVVNQLQAIADQQDRTADRLQVQQQTDREQRADTLAARRRLMNQNAELQRQVRALTNYLRAHGINVPETLTTPQSEPSNRPKARRQTSRGTPTPTEPSPRSPGPSGSPNLACQLVPSLCPFLSLSTLLP